MRIGIQASNMLATHLTGIEYSLTELVRQFAKLDERNDYVLYFNFVRSEYAERFESRVRPLLSDRVRASVCRVPNRVMNIARELSRRLRVTDSILANFMGSVADVYAPRR